MNENKPPCNYTSGQEMEPCPVVSPCQTRLSHAQSKNTGAILNIRRVYNMDWHFENLLENEIKIHVKVTKESV